MQARKLSIRRNSKFLGSEDLIFLIRHDKPKVNRLRTYLSWKDVRKNAKDSGDGAAPAGAGGPGGAAGGGAGAQGENGIEGIEDGAAAGESRLHPAPFG